MKNAKFLSLLFIAFLIVYMYWQSLSNNVVVHVAQAKPANSDLKIKTALGDKSYDDIDAMVFRPMGYYVVRRSLIPTLNFMQEPKCANVFSEWLNFSYTSAEVKEAPKEIPSQQILDFTLNGYSQLQKNYKNDVYGAQSTVWNDTDKLLKKSVLELDETYPNQGKSVYYAMQRANLQGLEGVVVGSQSPWVEIYALKNGAKKVLTVDYLKIGIEGTKQIEYLHPSQLAENFERHSEKYDFAVSFSSIEHSGLGRYGDRMDPIGDIREVLKIRCLLKKGGLLFLGFPVGQDTVVFNVHRFYGRIRLALLFTGFELVESYHASENPIELNAEMFTKTRMKQYLFVLKKV